MIAGVALALVLGASAGSPKIVDLWELGFVPASRGCAEHLHVLDSHDYFALGSCDEDLGDHVVMVVLSFDQIHGVAFAADDVSLDRTTLVGGTSRAWLSLEYAKRNGPALVPCDEDGMTWVENEPAQGWSFTPSGVTCGAMEMLVRACAGEPGTAELLRWSMLPGMVRR